MIKLYLINQMDTDRVDTITTEDIGKWMVETDDGDYICNNRQAADNLISHVRDEIVERIRDA